MTWQNLGRPDRRMSRAREAMETVINSQADVVKVLINVSGHK
jgi:hypothetical protein